MRKLFFLLFLFSLPAFGQGLFYSLPHPYPNGTLRVCPLGAANPCPAPASIFADIGLTLPIVQPVALGTPGNFGFWIAAGQYTIQISGTITDVFNITLGGSATATNVSTVSALPATCNPGPPTVDVVGLISSGLTTYYYCKSTNTWAPTSQSGLSFIDNGTTIRSPEPVYAPSFTATQANGGLVFPEGDGSAVGCLTGQDCLFGNSTNHCIEVVNNGIDTGQCVAIGAGVPTGVAAGSALVSNGVSTAPAYQTKYSYDVRDYGVDCTNTTDSTAAMQALINLVPNYSRIVIPQNCMIKVSGTPAITIDSRYGLEFDFLGRQGNACDIQTNNPASFNYVQTYASGNTILYVNRSQRLQFNNMTIYANGNADVGISVDQVGATPPINTRNDFYRTCVTNSGLRNASWVGIQLSHVSTSNVEAQHFYDPDITCSSQGATSITSNGTGIDLGNNSNNTKNEIVDTGGFHNCSIDVAMGAGSTNTMANGLSSNSYTNVLMNGFNDAVSGFRTENATNAVSIQNTVGPHLIMHSDFAAPVSTPIDCPSGGCGNLTLLNNESSSAVTWVNSHAGGVGALFAANNRNAVFFTTDWPQGAFILPGVGGTVNGLSNTAAFSFANLLLTPQQFDHSNNYQSPAVTFESNYGSAPSHDDYILQSLVAGGYSTSPTDSTLVLGNAGTLNHWLGFSGQFSGLNSTQAPAPTFGNAQVQNRGTAGTTSYSYQIVAHGVNGTTTASATGTITTGNATLTSTNYNLLILYSSPGATSYDVYRTASAGTPASTGKIGTMTAYYSGNPANGSSNTLYFSDTGLAGDSTSPPTINTTGQIIATGPFGAAQSNSSSSCELVGAPTTLSTVATATTTGLSCLPANSIIDAVVYRITTTITTAASFTIGDGTTAGRFCGTQSVLTAGTTGTCFVQADQTGAAGPRQPTAAAVVITTNVNPGAGAIRLIVFYHTWTPPTS